MVAIDDILDAAIALVSAARIQQGTATVLGDNEMDERGLRMEIVA
jgi:predicted RNase H-like nuclease